MISQPDRESIAYHEAGHTVLALALGRTVRYVSISPRAELRFRHSPDLISRAADAVQIAQAGHLAQMRAYPGSPNGQTVDLEIAFDAASYISNRPERFLERSRQRAQRLLDRHWRQVELIAAALLERGRLTGEEIAALSDRPAF